MNALLSAQPTMPFPNHLLIRTNNLEELVEKTYCYLDPRSTSLATPKCSTEIAVTRFALEHSQFFGVSHKKSIHTYSSPLKSLQISIPINGTLTTQTRKGVFKASPGEAILYMEGDLIDLNWSDQCKVLVVIINAAEFEHRLNRYFDFQFYQLKLEHPILRLASGAGLSLANLISLLLTEAENADSPVITGATSRSYEDMLLATVGHLVVSRQSLPLIRNSSLGMPGYIKRTVDFILANCQRDISISDLVCASNVSLRTLQNGFVRQFNKGPMTFVKQTKLRRVREELLAAQPEHTYIADIATKWGFYHQSNFAKSYYQLFDELPTDTLRKND